MHVIKAVSLAALIGAGSLLSGCATRESVEHAQATADLAASDAKAARGAADRAQSSADGAGKSAQDAMTLAQQANDKVDKFLADQAAKKKHMAKRRHRRHVAAASPTMAACPPVEQHGALKTGKKQAAATPRLKTAQN
jgi:hypothetical protein